MAKKQPTKKLKLQIEGGKATPAPPLGATLGQAGVNIGTFVNEFNDRTKDIMGQKVSVVLRVYDDRSFDFDVKTPITAGVILRTLGLKSGSGKNAVKKVGKISKAQLEEVAKAKMEDLNAKDLQGAVKIIEGQCRSMGIEIEG